MHLLKMLSHHVRLRHGRQRELPSGGSQADALRPNLFLEFDILMHILHALMHANHRTT